MGNPVGQGLHQLQAFGVRRAAGTHRLTELQPLEGSPRPHGQAAWVGQGQGQFTEGNGSVKAQAPAGQFSEERLHPVRLPQVSFPPEAERETVTLKGNPTQLLFWSGKNPALIYAHHAVPLPVFQASAAGPSLSPS
ncbi:hypothetical protein SAMN00790413_05279 [Deinococcus hopiensis KR-140]|uniref:Uncharacterized protein n=1 Tax=Deinococcus hopiensis KR-140 TaxID=695939 RepID=A0A1W1UUP8_9DEIO|nr:hypothetical protein SAMN00790413_05279 [Deinococcus hopiensis KR-140]